MVRKATFIPLHSHVLALLKIVIFIKNNILMVLFSLKDFIFHFAEWAGKSMICDPYDM